MLAAVFLLQRAFTKVGLVLENMQFEVTTSIYLWRRWLQMGDFKQYTYDDFKAVEDWIAYR